MWTIKVGGPMEDSHCLVFLLDETGTVRFSGPTLIEALRHLAEWGQEEAVLDVDSAIFFLGRDSQV